ncbi:MAG: NADH-quinone oxidoreductase subunit H [Verrucomicrobia bacterium]|nr:NADH-quinone oxidoreductase subunit H [Verrucomicrobiota bacterium]MCF7707777.1 NADH-quinone oxidoreductase subunit H [Verrucomicrobiota bacterium]
MWYDLLTSVFRGLVNTVLLLALAPLCEGIVRKLTARIQSRQGPPIRQAYYDILKLLGKEDIEVGESPVFQRLAAALGLASVLCIAWLIPMGVGIPFSGGDVILLVYLLALGAVVGVLAGIASGTTYSMLGVSREVMMLITLEPLLIIALLVAAVNGGSMRLEPVFSGVVFGDVTFSYAGLIMLLMVLAAFQAYVKRVPFDIAEAETEIMEGALMEYSGPKLALFKYAQMCRLVVYSGVFVALFVPWGNELMFPLGWLLFWLKVAVLVVLVTVLAASHARYRIDQAVRYFLVMVAVSFGALVLAALGY